MTSRIASQISPSDDDDTDAAKLQRRLRRAARTLDAALDAPSPDRGATGRAGTVIELRLPTPPSTPAPLHRRRPPRIVAITAVLPRSTVIGATAVAAAAVLGLSLPSGTVAAAAADATITPPVTTATARQPTGALLIRQPAAAAPVTSPATVPTADAERGVAPVPPPPTTRPATSRPAPSGPPTS